MSWLLISESNQIAYNTVVAFFRYLDINARGRIALSYCDKREKNELTLNVTVLRDTKNNYGTWGKSLKIR